ncbi:MAG: hypothetical protein II623_10115 [Paludibacteraceae bacterium]|nr:hypothetical protein [Paludibacteraceae bacterium]
MKKILFLLLAASANSWAVDMNPEDYGERVEDFGLKGPVKSYSAVSRNKSLYLAFNKDGLLTQGKATNVEGTASTLTTDFDIVGNIVRRTHTDFSLKCPECEKLTEEYKQLAADADVTTDYNKCKNNADFAKKQIKCNTTFEYNNKGELAKKVETKAVNEYEPFTTLYRYDEEGRKTGERHYRGNADNNKNSSDKWDDTWIYENGRLIKDNDYTYKYNKLGQLAEKSYKGDPNNKYVFTYLPSGKLKKRVYGNRKDTIVCNTNGDTVLYAHKSYFQYHRPDGEIERRIMPFTTSREITKFNKKNLRTSRRIYDENNAIAFEDIFDNEGNCIKSIFEDGHIERTFDKKTGYKTEKLFKFDIPLEFSEYNASGVCTREWHYDKDGHVTRKHVRTTDEYGNVIKHVETVYRYKGGENLEKEYVTTYTITYY